ncbi:MAG: hypothetical protein AAFY71_19205 [Bacteroidota bacterium]
MARNIFEIELTPDYRDQTFRQWLSENGYRAVEFHDGEFEVNLHYGANAIYHNLKERKGYTTYYKESLAQSLLVFEIQIQAGRMLGECYSPLMIFGFFRKELAFKKNASLMAPYLKKGFADMEDLKNTLGA